jgi:hypothetical protein
MFYIRLSLYASSDRVELAAMTTLAFFALPVFVTQIMKAMTLKSLSVLALAVAVTVATVKLGRFLFFALFTLPLDHPPPPLTQQNHHPIFRQRQSQF